MVSTTGNSADFERLVAARKCLERHLATSTNAAVEDVLRELVIDPESECGRAIIVDLMPYEIAHRLEKDPSPDLQRELQRFPFLIAQLEPLLAPLLQQTSSLDSFMPPVHATEDSQDSNSEHTTRDGRFVFEATVEPDEPLRSIGRYQLIEQVGRGGCGEVWLARDPELDREVAIKLIRRDRLQAGNAFDDLIREGRRVASLKHPGIVPVYDAGSINGTMYLVSEFCRQGTLKNLIKNGPLPAERAARITAAIADALHHAHLNGIVHRDIKPQNILLDDNGHPRLTDFGIAVTEQELVAEQPGTLGTFAYMSPEQMSGKSHLADPRADVYSLGVVLYELLTGRVPFIGTTYVEYRVQVLTREPRPPRTLQEGIPAELEVIVLRCMEKLVTDRYTTAADVATALRDVKWQESSVAKSGWISAALFLALVGGLLMVAVAWNRFLRPTEQLPHQGLVDLKTQPPVGHPDPESPEDVWADRLGMKPVEMMWPGVRGRRELIWSKDQPKVTLLSDRPFLTQFGTIPAQGSQIIRIRLERLTTWEGGGIFWDYRELENDNETIGTAQLLELGPANKSSADQAVTYRLSRSLATLDPQEGYLIRRATRSVTIPTPLNRSALLEMDFSNRGLARVKLNSYEYADLALDPVPDGPDILAFTPFPDGAASVWGGLTDEGSLSSSLD